MRNKLINLIGIAFALALLSACGGDSVPPPPTLDDCVIGTSTIGDCKI